MSASLASLLYMIYICLYVAVFIDFFFNFMLYCFLFVACPALELYLNMLLGNDKVCLLACCSDEHSTCISCHVVSCHVCHTNIMQLFFFATTLSVICFVPIYLSSYAMLACCSQCIIHVYTCIYYCRSCAIQTSFASLGSVPSQERLCLSNTNIIIIYHV
jgi:hypothetical protein